jgi:hypothetical protein
MKKIDLSKKHKAYYSALDRPELVEVEAAAFLCIQGKGDPSSEEFRQAVQALYASAYGIKFLCKLREKDFVVAKLEGLWSYDKTKYASISMEEAPTRIPRADWTYTLMIRIPEFVTRQDLHQALEVARMKKKIAFEQEIKRVEIPAHRAVQILHKGSFDKEPESLQEISSFMKEHAFQQGGQHHEIYLSDFRKTVPDKLRTILREPIK